MKTSLKQFNFDMGVLAAVSTWISIFIITLVLMFEKAMPVIDVSLVSTFFCIYLYCFMQLPNSQARAYSKLMEPLLLVVMLAMTYLIVMYVPAGYLSILTIIWVAVLVNFVSIKHCLIISAIVVITWFMVFSWRWNIDDMWFSAVLYGCFHLFAILMSHQTQEAEQAKQHIERVNQELQATQELVKQASRQQERTRIARDLHDLVGHHLTALIINLEVAKHQTDGPAKQQIEQSHALAKLLLSDVREAISQIRAHDSIDMKALIELWRSYIPSMNISTDIDESIAWSDLAITQTLSFCILEALTNSMRHAGATELTITIVSRGDRIITRIVDNGQVKGDLTFGNGLHGMQERLATINGSLNTEIVDGHLELMLDIPEETHNGD